jgi:hypothetical protein
VTGIIVITRVKLWDLEDIGPDQDKKEGINQKLGMSQAR